MQPIELTAIYGIRRGRRNITILQVRNFRVAHVNALVVDSDRITGVNGVAVDGRRSNAIEACQVFRETNLEVAIAVGDNADVIYSS